MSSRTLAIPACWTWPEPDWKAIRKSATDEYYQRLAICIWQDDHCAVCGKHDIRLREDHDHETGLTRGWLCHQCNVRDGARWRGVYAMYRECNPAVILGFTVRYIDPVTGLPAEPARPWTQERWDREAEITRQVLERAFGGST